MDSIINRLTEIEETASSIVEHAEEQKAVLDKEYWIRIPQRFLTDKTAQAEKRFRR